MLLIVENKHFSVYFLKILSICTTIQAWQTGRDSNGSSEPLAWVRQKSRSKLWIHEARTWDKSGIKCK